MATAGETWVFWVEKVFGLLTSWAFVTLMLVLFILWTQRKRLGELLDRGFEAGPGGLKVPPRQVVAPDALPRIEQQAAQPLRPSLQSTKERLISQMNNQPGTPEAKLDGALTSLAYALHAAAYERLLRSIWRSQIDMLRRARGNGGQIPIEVANAFYEEGRQRSPAAYTNYPLQSWLAFLTGSNLVQLSQDGLQVRLTDLGDEFLRFIADAPSPEPALG